MFISWYFEPQRAATMKRLRTWNMTQTFPASRHIRIDGCDCGGTNGGAAV